VLAPLALALQGTSAAAASSGSGYTASAAASAASAAGVCTGVIGLPRIPWIPLGAPWDGIPWVPLRLPSRLLGIPWVPLGAPGDSLGNPRDPLGSIGGPLVSCTIHNLLVPRQEALHTRHVRDPVPQSTVRPFHQSAQASTPAGTAKNPS